MRGWTLPLIALVLLGCLNIGACDQGSFLGKAVAQLFNDQQRVKEVSHNAWKTARDEGPRASMKKSSEHLQKAIASAEAAPEKAAPDAFAAWWYNVAAQYWSENAAKKPDGELFVTPVEGIIRARKDLERALGWDAETANRFHQEAY